MTTSKRIRKLMESREIELSLDEMAARIARSSSRDEEWILMGMATRGIPLAKRLAERLEKQHNMKISIGTLDATLYRDDFHYRSAFANPKMQITKIPHDIDGASVLLVDDVLYTGRTIRAAMEALMDLGRAQRIRLAVLVDRGRRELPIAPDFAGLTLETRDHEEVRVSLLPDDSEDSVWLVEVDE
jgi:pyrimidine operon attenuation protein/uracil phosphoribosyltransferase